MAKTAGKCPIGGMKSGYSRRVSLLTSGRLIGAFIASYRILDGMLQATSPQTPIAVAGGALVTERGI
jgi:hypothetical protein